MKPGTGTSGENDAFAIHVMKVFSDLDFRRLLEKKFSERQEKKSDASEDGWNLSYHRTKAMTFGFQLFIKLLINQG